MSFLTSAATIIKTRSKVLISRANSSWKEFTIYDLRFTMGSWIWPPIWIRFKNALLPHANAPGARRAK
jgi:hypothetical protein